ncbi:MAG: hypothetical protein EOM54_01035 [Clostridia bacterium]|nr:hypothetical protein [Clostridia bacterium]
MSDLFLGFTEEVCRFVKHATPAEKKEIREELRTHLEDHADDLAAHGYSREEAEERAVATMGSPGEIGGQLDRQYPFIWLFLSRASVVVALVLALLVFLPSLGRIGQIAESLRARIAPMSYYSEYRDGYVLQNRIDIRREGAAGDIVCFYAADVVGSDAYIAVTRYDRNPLKGVSGADGLTFTGADGTARKTRGVGASAHGAAYDIYRISVEDGDDAVSASYDLHGTSFRVEIPLDWEASA